MSLDKKRQRADSSTLPRATSVLLCAFLLSSCSFAKAEAQPATNLSPGSIERAIAAADRHGFDVPLIANQLLHLSLEKGDLAVRLIISDDAGHSVLDQVSRVYEVMEISVVARTSGNYHLEIHSLESKDGRDYQLRLAPFRKATSADFELEESQQLVAKASWLRDEWKETSFLQAIENYDKAARIALGRNERMRVNALEQAGRVLTVLGKYDDAIQRFRIAAGAASKAGDRVEEARALGEASRLRSYVGGISDAEESLRKAFTLLASTESVSDSARQANAESLSSRGEVNYSKGNLISARADFENALKLFAECRDRAGEARVHLFKGYIFGSIGDSERAVTEVSQGSDLYRAVGNKAGEAFCLTALGISRSIKRDVERAMALHREAAEIFRSIGDRQSQAITLNAWGQVYEFISDYSTALVNYQKALSMLGDNPTGDVAAGSMFKIARMQRLLGNLDESLRSYERCLQLSRAAGKQRTEVNALNEVALIYASKGNREQTVAQYGRIVKFYARISDPRGQATTLTILGNFLARNGEKQEALASYKKALAFSESCGDKSVLIATLSSLARVNRDLGALEDALRYAQRSIQIVEDLRTNVATPDFRTSYFSGVRQQYELLIDILMRCENAWPGRGYAAQAFLGSENARARSLIDMRAEVGADIRTGVSPALLERERGLQGLLRAHAAYQMDLSVRKSDAHTTAEVARQIDDLRDEYLQIEAQIRDRNPRVLALKQSAPLSLEQVQKDLLDDDSVVLEYALGEERSYLWVISRTSFGSYELPSRNNVEAAAQDVYQGLTARQLVGKLDSGYQANVDVSDASYSEKALSLSRMLVGPANAQLGTKRLLVVTDGLLQYIPLDALPVPEPEKVGADPISDRLPLVALHEVVMLPSLSTLAAIRQEKNRSQADDKIVAVLADPVFDNGDDRAPGNTSGRGASFTGNPNAPALRGIQVPAFDSAPARLTHAAEEANAIVAVAPHGSAMLALGFDATRETAMSSLVGEYRIVHFAAHGFVNKEHPELSGILLSTVDRSGNKTNGFVPVRDIYNLNLSADLVVLSACESALGKDVRGEGLVGLTHGFMASGSKSVIASLWKVDDRATSMLMAEFYRSMLQDGLSPAAALRSAKEKIRREKSWQAPYFWAGFVLQGEYNEHILVNRRSSLRSLVAVVLVSVLIVVGIAFLYRHRRRLVHHAN